MTDDTKRLAALIQAERSSLLAVWRAELRALPTPRHLDTPTLNDHIPGFLDELATVLAAGTDRTTPEAHFGGTAPTHGKQRFDDGFEIEEVVAEYNILRRCVHDLACEHGINLQGEPFRLLNRVIDEAIGTAVSTYARKKEDDTKRRREDYLAFVAHDLRTPLNAISLVAQALETSVVDGEPAHFDRKMLSALKRNVQRLSVLVSHVLDENNRIEVDASVKVERRVFDLWPLVETLIRGLRPVSGQAGTRIVNAVPLDFEVYADAALLSRVFDNLLANAIRYAPNGTVEVHARKLDDQGSVECTVRDDGAGIPRDLIDKVFDKNETDGSKDGRGLGLAIFKTFVEAHDGTVAVESVEGEGATFRFTLPRKVD